MLLDINGLATQQTQQVVEQAWVLQVELKQLV